MAAVSARGGRRRRTMNEINMVPFIDVMLVLLIIFMVSAPMITTGLVDLPSVGKSRQQPDHVIQVIVGTDERLKIKVDQLEPESIPVNRLAERVKLGALREADVRKLLARRLGHDDPASTKAVHAQVLKLAEANRPHGNLAFVDAVCERVRDQETSPVTHDAILAGIAAELARR